NVPSASRASADVGQSVTFTSVASLGSGGYTYTWSGLPAGCVASGSSALCTPVSAAVLSLSVTVKDSDGYAVTSGSLSYTVFADPKASTPTAVPSTVDVGQATTISTSASLGSGGYTYLWGGLPTGCSGSGASLSCTPTASGTFTVSVTVTDSNGFSTTSSGLSLSVYADPTVPTPTASRPSADVGQSVTFTASPTGGSGGFTYAWNGLPPGCAGATSSIVCTVTGSGPFTVSVKATDSNGFAATSGGLAFTVYSDPTVATPSALPSSVDVGQTTTLSDSASSGSGGFTYAWSGLPAGCSGATSTLACDPSTSGTFSVSLKATDSNGVSATSPAVTLTVDPDPTVGAPSASPASADVGQSVTFSVSASSGSGGFTYVWSGLPSGCSGSSASVPCAITVAGSSVVSVSVTDSNGFTVASVSTSFTADPDPLVSAPTPSPASVDVGQSVAFSVVASLGSGGYTYAWSGLPAGCGAGTPSVSCLPTTAGPLSISVRVTDSNGLAVVSAALAYTVHALPQIAASPSASRASADVGQSITFSVSASAGLPALGAPAGGAAALSLTYDWTSSNASLSCASSAGPSVTCVATAAGTYTVHVVVTDSNGGTSSSTSSAYVVLSDPSATAPTFVASTIDVGGLLSVSETASGGASGYTYVWSGLPTGCASTAASFTCHANASGTYAVTVRVTDANGFASAAASASLVVNPSIAVTLSGSGLGGSVTSGENVSFTAIATGGTNPLSYAWRFSDGGGASGSTVAHTFGSSGSFSVEVWVNDSAGGSASKNYTVSVAKPAATFLGVAPVAGYALLGALLLLAALLVLVGLVALRRRGRGPAEAPAAVGGPAPAPPAPWQPGGAGAPGDEAGPTDLDKTLEELERISNSRSRPKP
ncbi:MAG TPA: PKD domain-containing protein, partial [Thermoplasmata archaeon]|nr:PKD domain-containing protein [Thermoplasmata archaeon]